MSAGSAEASAGGPGPSRARQWRWAAVAIVVVALAAWAIRDRWIHTRFQWDTFAGSFADLHWGWLAAAAAAALSTYYGRALRWAVMLKPMRPRPDAWGVFKATAIGFTAIVLLGRPGEFVRPYLISLKERVPLSSQLAAWFLERVCDLLVVALVFGFSVSQIQASQAQLSPTFRWVLETGGYVMAGLGLLSVVLLFLMGRYSGAVRRRLLEALAFLPHHLYCRAERIVTAFVEGTSALKSPRSVVRLMAYTAFEWFLIVLCFLFLFRAYPATAAFTAQDVLIFIGFVAFGGVLQIPGVGGGMQIVSIVVLTQLYALPLEIATSLALVAWITTFVIIVPVGLLLAFHEGLNWRKFRDLERRAARAGEALEAHELRGDIRE